MKKKYYRKRDNNFIQIKLKKKFYQKLIMIIQKLFYRILKYQIIHILNMNGIIVFNLEEGAI